MKNVQGRDKNVGFLTNALAVVLLVDAATRLHAQANPPPGDGFGELTEIVVTAQRRSENLKDVPISITAVTPQQLTDFGIKTTDALQLVTPDLTFDKGYSYAENYIRGIGSAFTNPGLESAVATYVDGAYMERSFGTVFDLLDVNSVEVLKGPQGTLYGRNATGGAILILTADPTNTEAVHIAAEGGSMGHGMGELMVNIPVSSTLAMRIAAREDHDGHYINNLYDGSKFGQRTSGEIRAKLRWTPSENLSAVLTFDHSDVQERAGFTQERYPAPECLACAIPGAGGAPVAGFYNTDNDTNVPFITRTTAANLKVNYTVGIYDLTSITAFRNDSISAKIDLDLTSVPLYDFKEGQNGKSYSQDLQLVTKGSGWINGLIAASYFRDQASIYANLTGGAFAPLLAALDELPVTQNDVLTQSETVALEAYLTPIDHLKITLGARYTHDARSLGVDSNLAGVLGAGFPPTDPLSLNQSASFNSTTPRVVVAYDLDLVKLYASYNRGFKAGGFNTPSFSVQGVIRPEKIDSYEVGAKFVSTDRRLRANIAAFHYKYSDVQVSVIDLAAGGASIQNAACARANGAEGDFDYRVTRWLQLLVGVGYLDAKYTNYANASVVFETPTGLAAGTEDLSDTPLTRAPRFNGYIGADAHSDIGEGWVGHLNVIAHRTAKYAFSPGMGGSLEYDYQPAYTLANLTASVGPSSERYKLGLYINNLTNAKYDIQRGTSAPFGIFDQVARPITYGARVEYNF